MLALLRQRLILKLGALMLATVASGFMGSAMLVAHKQRTAMERRHQQTASLFARGLAAGVRSSMLTGDPLATRALLANANEGLRVARVRVFAPDGDEVFAPPPPPPPRASLPAALREALSTGQPQHSANDTDLIPMAHEERCTRCHDPPGTLRGVLEIGAGAAPRALSDDTLARAAIATTVRAGFVQIMTARRTEHLDDFFAELKLRAPAVSDVTVYTASGYPAFGNQNIEDTHPSMTSDAVRAVVESNTTRTIVSGNSTIEVIPLVNDIRCHSCHRPADRMRGAIAIVTPTAGIPATATLAQVSELSVRHIMLSGLGGLTRQFLDSVARTGAVSTLRLYDPEGRIYHDATRRPPPPSHISRALEGSGGGTHFATQDGNHAAFVFVETLHNDETCQRCHGADRQVRGALEVRIDTSDALRERKELTRWSAIFALGTMLAVAFALYLALRVFVLGPVSRLTEVAEHIGRGNLDVEARITSHDEVGRLGGRLNEMIGGLRQRLHLSKFVSQGTMDMVASHGRGTMKLGGERRHIVVLFSDIRGFTSFSESREPEDVVAMLNVYLDRQTDVVVKHGGDIDKFVGDELMALFLGDDAEARATRCGVEMIEAVQALNAERGIDAIAIGVGINAGTAIVGAMGAAARMDYTAIGDTVNLGARLCSNADRDQLLISEPVRARAGVLDGIEIDALAPIKVKGKSQPIQVFAARRSGAARRDVGTV